MPIDTNQELTEYIRTLATKKQATPAQIDEKLENIKISGVFGGSSVKQ